MKNFARILIAVFALCAFALADDKPVKLSLPELQQEPAKYDGKVVEVTAPVAGFKQKTSQAGNKYFTLKLAEDGKTVNDYSRGELGKELKDGAKVMVTGIFRVEKKLGSLVFKNEIDCTKQEGKPYGIKEVPKG